MLSTPSTCENVMKMKCSQIYYKILKKKYLFEKADLAFN